MKFLGMHVERRSVLYGIGDAGLALISLATAWAIRFEVPLLQADLLALFQRHTGATVIFVVAHLFLLYIAEAYDPARDFRKPAQIARIWGAVAFGAFFQMALFYAIPEWQVGRGFFGIASAVYLATLTFWRGLMCQVRPRLIRRLRTVILGADHVGHHIANAIAHHSEHSDRYELIGFVDDPDEIIEPVEERSALPLVGGRSALAEWVDQERVECIIVAIRAGMSDRLTRQLLECKAKGVQIEDMRVVYTRMTGKLPIQFVSDTSIIFGPAFAGTHGGAAVFQRLADIGISIVGLLLTGPIIALAALAVRLDSKGPAFYTQVRVGQNEHDFVIYKLRTMVQDAEAKTGATWSKGRADPRVTRVGAFLRRTRIDELPQFFNVLNGTMSMVGPRPERPVFVAQLKKQIPYYGLRFAVKPGVTGWAQVMYRYGASVEETREKLCYDLYAIQELNPFLYVIILLKTVQTVILKPGS
mgnify:CR=1 FL=1